MDTVDKEVAGFNLPPFMEKEPTQLFNLLINKKVEVINQAWFASREAIKRISIAFPNNVNFTMPSPIYPDLVCLPLMSKERCYGPWVSSQIDVQSIVYSNIGGRIEFIKDENLAPWNYDGYYLMNQAGIEQAKFAQSLLLFSERGGFVVPGIPPKVSLGKSLLNLGPLVTNLQVDVSDAGIKTTIKMDLYTANFGKLQKQKQEAISKLSRERQKLKDERNALIRKGLGKAQASVNYLKEYEKLQKSTDATLSGKGSLFTGPSNATNVIALGVNKNKELRWSSSPSVGEQGVHEVSQYTHEGSVQSYGDIAATVGQFTDVNDFAVADRNSVTKTIPEIFAPASLAPDHESMPSQQSVASTDGFYSLYFNQETPFEQQDIT
jgi:hypothetical protein